MKTSAVDKGRRSVDVMRGNVDAAAARSFGWVQELQNDTGSDILEGSVVAVRADGTIELCDIENDPRPIGVVVDQIDDGDTGQVVFGGPVDLVLVTASVTAGQFGATSTTPGEAQVTTASNALCWFTSSGTSPTAFIFPDRNGRGATVVAGANIEDFPTAETNPALVLHPDGAGNVVWGVDATGGVPWSYAQADGGLAGDGVTDDTAAFQAWIDSVTASGTKSGWFFFEEGVYLIGGALQDTSGFNGQILLPSVSISDTSITLVFQGPTPPVFNAWGPIPDPNGGAIIKSTLTGGSGTASVISGGTLAGDANRNNISVYIENLTCLAPDNPSLTFWSLISTQSGGYKNLRIIGGGSVVEPTHSNAYGIKYPGWADSNYTPVDGVMVLFYYTGHKLGELTRGNVIASLCKVGVETDTVEHATTLVSVQVTGCQVGIKIAGDTFGDCYLYDAEHLTTPAWAVTTYDVDDPSDLWYGHLRWWGVAFGGTPDHSFTVNGAANLLYEEIGQPPAGTGTVATDAIWDAKGDLAAGTGADTAAKLTVGANDTILMADSAASTGLKWVASQTPSTQAFQDAAAQGTADTYSRGDHKHGMPAGGSVLLEQHTASSSAQLDFTTAISSTYDEYLIEIVNLVPATNNTSLLMRASTDGGSTYDTSGIYDYTSGYAYSGGVGVGASATGQGNYLLMDAISNSANYGVIGHIRLYSPGGAVYKQIIGQTQRYDQGGAIGLVSLAVMGVYRSTTAVNALRFLMSSGNIASGTIRIYGLAK